MKIVGDDEKEPKFATLRESYGSRPLAIWDIGLESFVPSAENPEALGIESCDSQLGDMSWPMLALKLHLVLGLEMAGSSPLSA